MGPEINGWQLDAEGVYAVGLDNLLRSAEFRTTAWPATTHESVAGAKWVSNGNGVLGPTLAAALSLFMTGCELTVAGMERVVAAAGMGAMSVAACYGAADTAMAAQAQGAMVDSSSTGDYTWFEKNIFVQAAR